MYLTKCYHQSPILQDSVYKIMEANLKSPCKILHKVSKGNEIRFKVVLSKDEVPESNDKATPTPTLSAANTPGESLRNPESKKKKPLANSESE